MRTSFGVYILIGLCIAGAIAVYFVARQRLPLKLQRFKDRRSVSLDDLHDEFYRDYAIEQFSALWNEIASAVDVRPELIRPTDRFDRELGPVKGFEVASEMDDLEEAVMRRCKQHGLDSRNVRIETVDDYIKTFCRTARP